MSGRRSQIQQAIDRLEDQLAAKRAETKALEDVVGALKQAAETFVRKALKAVTTGDKP